MSAYEKPQQRKGFTITAVQWDRQGKVVRVKYERTVKVKPEPVEPPRAEHPHRHRGLLL